MAVGDNLNDVDMLDFAGVAVVMGNATDALKSRGYMQTGTKRRARPRRRRPPLRPESRIDRPRFNTEEIRRRRLSKNRFRLTS
jgi:hypothetical protein